MGNVYHNGHETFHRVAFGNSLKISRLAFGFGFRAIVLLARGSNRLEGWLLLVFPLYSCGNFAILLTFQNHSAEITRKAKLHNRTFAR